MENRSVVEVQTIRNLRWTCAGTDRNAPLTLKALFDSLSQGQGKQLRTWVTMVAQQRNQKVKNVRKLLRIRKADYQVLMRGGYRVRRLPASVFAKIADWLGISIIAALSAAGIANIDERREAVSRGMVIDLALDTIARDPVWGEMLPVSAYLAEERVKETIARLYQALTGSHMIPDPQDWDQILDEVVVMLCNQRRDVK